MTNMNEFEAKLHAMISNQLPGENAHLGMAPINRKLSSIAKAQAQDVRDSAVAIVLFEENDAFRFILIQRPTYEGNHSGQISFPGGKKDPEDENLEATAKRECMEEVGIDLSKAKSLGKLTPVYIPVSNFHVEPYVFFYPEIPNIVPDEREVASVFSVSTHELVDESNVSTMTVPLGDGFTLRDVPCFLINGKQIWGATALILNEMKEILKTF